MYVVNKTNYASVYDTYFKELLNDISKESNSSLKMLITNNNIHFGKHTSKTGWIYKYEKINGTL